MLTDMLLGFILVGIGIALTLVFSQLDDIRQQLERIERRQLAICDELDLELQDEAQTAASPRQPARVQ